MTTLRLFRRRADDAVAQVPGSGPDDGPRLRVWRGNAGAGDWLWRVTSSDGRWLATGVAVAHADALVDGTAALTAARPGVAQ